MHAIVIPFHCLFTYLFDSVLRAPVQGDYTGLKRMCIGFCDPVVNSCLSVGRLFMPGAVGAAAAKDTSTAVVPAPAPTGSGAGATPSAGMSRVVPIGLSEADSAAAANKVLLRAFSKMPASTSAPADGAAVPKKTAASRWANIKHSVQEESVRERRNMSFDATSLITNWKSVMGDVHKQELKRYMDGKRILDTVTSIPKQANKNRLKAVSALVSRNIRAPKSLKSLQKDSKVRKALTHDAGADGSSCCCCDGGG